MVGKDCMHFGVRQGQVISQRQSGVVVKNMTSGSSNPGFSTYELNDLGQVTSPLCAVKQS